MPREAMSYKRLTTADLVQVRAFIKGKRSEAREVSVEDLATPLATVSTLVSPSSVATLTNKRITPRVATIAYGAEHTPEIDLYDIINIGELTGDITITEPDGTPTDGQELTFRFQQDVTGAHAITWNGVFDFGTTFTEAMLPTDDKYEVTFRYNATAGKWRCVSIIVGF